MRRVVERWRVVVCAGVAAVALSGCMADVLVTQTLAGGAAAEQAQQNAELIEQVEDAVEASMVRVPPPSGDCPADVASLVAVVADSPGRSALSAAAQGRFDTLVAHTRGCVEFPDADVFDFNRR